MSKPTRYIKTVKQAAEYLAQLGMRLEVRNSTNYKVWNYRLKDTYTNKSSAKELLEWINNGINSRIGSKPNE